MTINLSVGHLRAVVALADHGTFTAAAETLGIAQSSLSRAIGEAERRLRTPLFQRTTRRVDVTGDGSAVVGVARRILAVFDAGIEHMQGYLDGTRGSLRIAALPSLAATLAPSVVHALRAELPHLEVTIDDRLSEGIDEGLQTGAADFALTAYHDHIDPRHDVVDLATDTFVAAVPPSHPLASAPSTSWAALDGEPLVVFSGATSIRRIVDRALHDHEVSPSGVVEAQNVGSVAGLVDGGLGIAAVPGFVLPLLTFADLRYIPLLPEVHRRIVLVRDHRRPLSPAAATAIGLLAAGQFTRPSLPRVTWAST